MSKSVIVAVGTIVAMGASFSATQNLPIAAGVGLIGISTYQKVEKEEREARSHYWENLGQSYQVPAVAAAVFPTIAPSTEIQSSASVTIANNFNPRVIQAAPTPATVPAFPKTVPTAPRWDEDESITPSLSSNEPLTGEQVLRLAIGYPAVLVYGAQGSGKSTVAKWIVQERAKLQHEVTILDPHQIAGQWEGNYEMVGRGMDYRAIDNALGQVSALIKQRYERLSNEPDFNPRPKTIVLEEFTNWSGRCTQSGDFWDTAMSDIRKVNILALFISHGRNLSQLGGGRGAKTRDETLFEINLGSTLDPQTGECRPTLKGTYKFPGKRPIDFDVPQLSFTSTKPDPRNIPENQLIPILKKISDSRSREELAGFLDCDPTGNSPKWAKAVELWDLVKMDGVSGAYDRLTTTNI